MIPGTSLFLTRSASGLAVRDCPAPASHFKALAVAARCFYICSGSMMTANSDFVSYLRVSTSKQGASGLGLEAQRSAVANYLNGGRWRIAAEFVEVESGRKSDRPELEKALAFARL
jgi:hypothetical protein